MATVLSSTEIQVNWAEVTEIDRNGIITQYEVMYELLYENGTVATNGSEVVGNSSFTVILSGLDEFMTYNISVRAYTSEGPGLYSVPEQTLMTLQGRKFYGTKKLCIHASVQSSVLYTLLSNHSPYVLLLPPPQLLARYLNHHLPIMKQLQPLQLSYLGVLH